MKEQIKNVLGGLGVIVGIVLVAYLAVETKNKASSVDYSKTIQMSAEGKVTAKPDLALLSFAVVSQGRDSAAVQRDNDAKMATVIDYIKSNSVNTDDIETSGYNLYPNYDYGTTGVTPGTITGYNLTQNVTVRIRNLDAVATILGGLTGKGVNQINNVTYTIDDPDKFREDARNEAIDKAKQKASELASRIGVKLGKIVNFSEGITGEPYPIPYAAERGFGGSASPVEPGTQDVIVNVTLTFELK